MKKLISILLAVVMAFSVVGCAADTQKNNNAATGSYKNLDEDVKEKIDRYVRMINVILDLDWSSERPEDLWMESDEFRYVLDAICSYEQGNAPSDSGNIVKVSDYADVAYRYFNIEEDVLRSILSTGTYDFSTDTLLYNGSITVEAKITITKVETDQNTYTVYYTRKYDGYEDRDYFVALNTGVLTMNMDENGCSFISNKVKRSEYDSIGGDRLKPLFQRYLTALGDMLNYSWDESGKGTLFTQPYGKSVQAYIDRAGAMLYGYETNNNWTRYVSSAQKFLHMEKDRVLQMLGYDGENFAKYTREEIKPDSGNFRIIDSISYKDGLHYIDYINGIRTLDPVTGRYQLQNAVKSQLVVKNVDGSAKILANRNAYYDVHENKRFQHYLDLLAPVLKYSWDETAVNTLTMDTNALKVAGQNLDYNYNLVVFDGTVYTDFYKRIADRYFEFGLAGCEYALSSDYKSEDGTVSAGVNTEEAETARLTDVVYSGDDVMIYYQQGDDSGLLTVRKYDNGIEKFVSNTNAYRRLTLQELEQINAYYRNTLRWRYVLRDYFEIPEKMDVSNIVCSLPAESWLTYDCYYEVSVRKKNGVALDYDRLEKGLEEYGRISPQSVENVLRETMNISLEQLENPYVDYSPEYSCYYKSKEYSPYSSRLFTDGYIIGDTVTLYNKHRCLTLKKTEDKYYVYSLTQNEKSYTFDMYVENGISTKRQYFVRDIYLEQEPGKSVTYNNAINAYNDFLSGKISVNDEKCDPDFWVVNSGGYGPISSYGVMDLNRDNIPELIVYNRSFMYDVYSYKNGSIIQWNVPFYGGMNGPDVIFTDGMVASGHISTGAWYDFYRFNADGSSTNIMSFEWYETMNHFKFNGRMVTKEEFERLIDPWLDKIKKYPTVETASYFQSKEYWEIYADKLQ